MNQNAAAPISSFSAAQIAKGSPAVARKISRPTAEPGPGEIVQRINHDQLQAGENAWYQEVEPHHGVLGMDRDQAC